MIDSELRLSYTTVSVSVSNRLPEVAVFDSELRLSYTKVCVSVSNRLDEDHHVLYLSVKSFSVRAKSTTLLCDFTGISNDQPWHIKCVW